MPASPTRKAYSHTRICNSLSPQDSTLSTKPSDYLSLYSFSTSTIRMSRNTPNNENTSLNISTFNVNGLGQCIKRLAIFHKMKHDNGTILLQETYLTSKTEQKWKNEWVGQIVFSPGTSNSWGIAIIFPPTLDYNILEKHSDNDGQFLLLKCKFEGAIYIVVNFYAPHNNIKMTK